MTAASSMQARTWPAKVASALHMIRTARPMGAWFPFTPDTVTVTYSPPSVALSTGRSMPMDSPGRQVSMSVPASLLRVPLQDGYPSEHPRLSTVRVSQDNFFPVSENDGAPGTMIRRYAAHPSRGPLAHCVRCALSRRAALAAARTSHRLVRSQALGCRAADQQRRGWESRMPLPQARHQY